MKSRTSPPDPADWDFSSCPDEQVRACLYYETARESEAVKKYRQSEAFKGTPIEGPSLGTRYIAFLSPEFPRTPWLKIDADARVTRLREAELADLKWRVQDGIVISNYALAGFNCELAEAQIDFERSVCEEGPALEKLAIRSIQHRKVTWVGIALDWTKSKPTLEREFKELLNELPDTFAEKHSGRCTDRDRLNALAQRG